MSLASDHKSKPLADIPPEDIKRRYGNSEGSFLLYRDGSKGWIDPATGDDKIVLHFIQ